MSNLSCDLSIKLGNEIISNCQQVKLLRITLNNSLNFEIHVAKSSAKKLIKNFRLLQGCLITRIKNE